MIESLVDAFIADFELFVDFIPRLIIALIVFILIYFAGKIIASATLQIIKRGNFHETYHAYFIKLVKGIFVLIGFIIFLNLIGYNALSASLVAGGGLTAVMVGFAFKDIGEKDLPLVLIFQLPCK